MSQMGSSSSDRAGGASIILTLIEFARTSIVSDFPLDVLEGCLLLLVVVKGIGDS